MLISSSIDVLLVFFFLSFFKNFLPGALVSISLKIKNKKKRERQEKKEKEKGRRKKKRTWKGTMVLFHTFRRKVDDS